MFKGLFDFRQSFNLRFEILLPIFGFIILGLFVLSSTSLGSNLSMSNFFQSVFFKHITFLSLGVLVFIISQYIRIQFLYDYSYMFYILLFFLLFLTLFSREIEGSKRWILIGESIRFQPSEFGKILYILCISRFLVDNKKNDDFSLYFFIALFILILPVLFILIQPDLGTSMVYLSIILPMLFWSGLSWKKIILLVAPFISVLASYNITTFFIWMFIFTAVIVSMRPRIYVVVSNFLLNFFFGIISPIVWNNVLLPHQKQRILIFLNPFSDPYNTGYQLIQSIISIGSGGFIGKGWGEGSQTQLKFLPVRDTDFIMSVMSEEFGFGSIFFVLFLLSAFIFWCVTYAQKVENRYASLLIIGLSTILFMHMIINLSVISGLLPVTGLPAPFISYGGSFLLTCTITIGLINNIINNYI